MRLKRQTRHDGCERRRRVLAQRRQQRHEARPRRGRPEHRLSATDRTGDEVKLGRLGRPCPCAAAAPIRHRRLTLRRRRPMPDLHPVVAPPPRIDQLGGLPRRIADRRIILVAHARAEARIVRALVHGHAAQQQEARIVLELVLMVGEPLLAAGVIDADGQDRLRRSLGAVEGS